MFFELIDDNAAGILIDRFVINVTDIPVSSTTNEIKTIQGIFGFAAVNVMIRLVCTVNYYGPTCDTLCFSNCACSPGFTGEFCATSINDCVGVECGENQRCVDAHLNYTCECEPGHTGPDCLTDMDNCIAVDCNNGVCVDEIASFSCVCETGYVGDFCETSTMTDHHTDPPTTEPTTLRQNEETTADSGGTSTIIIILIVLVALLLMVVVITLVAFSAAFCLKRKKNKGEINSDANLNHPATNSSQQAPQIGFTDHNYDYPTHTITSTTDPSYDYPKMLTESQGTYAYANNSQARAAVPRGEDEMGDPQTWLQCSINTAYNVSVVSNPTNELEESDHIYY